MTRRAMLWRAAVCCLMGSPAGAATVTKNIDIQVTHNTSSVITAATFKNSDTVATGDQQVIIFGQGFARGDIPASDCPDIRDAKTHVSIPRQQWDQVSTRHYNGDDGSWLHGVYSIPIPSIAAGGTYQIEFVRKGSPCASQT